MASYPKNKKDDPAEFEDVYAGPGMWSGEEPDDPEEVKEEVGKDPVPPEPEFVCVYAGPEYFGFKEEEPEPEPEDADTVPEESEPSPEPDMPEDKKSPEIPPEAIKNTIYDNSNKPYEGVYAGPRNTPDTNQFMAAYAGPQFMMVYAGPQMNNGGAFAPPPQPREEKKKICASCGAEMPERAKFCGKCGTKFPQKKYCHMCGSELIEGSKFCTECGALIK